MQFGLFKQIKLGRNFVAWKMSVLSKSYHESLHATIGQNCALYTFDWLIVPCFLMAPPSVYHFLGICDSWCVSEDKEKLLKVSDFNIIVWIFTLSDFFFFNFMSSLKPGFGYFYLFYPVHMFNQTIYLIYLNIDIYVYLLFMPSFILLHFSQCCLAMWWVQFDSMS